LFVLFIGYRSNPSAAADYEMTIDAYVAVLSDVPVWAAITACRDWPRGKYDDEHTSARHPPTTAELHRAAKTEAASAERDLERLMRTGGVTYRAGQPGEKTVAPEEEFVQSPKVAAGLMALGDEFRANVPHRKTEAQKQREAVASFEARCAELGIDPASIRDQPSTFRRVGG
jgi:hypothetical protein